jgi:hypothetical protein
MKLPGSKKKTIACPRCHAPVPEGNAFCDACGARTVPPPFCSLCGTLLEPGARFCSSCGTIVGKSPEAPEPVPETPVAAPGKKKQPRAKKPRAPEAAGEKAAGEETREAVPEPRNPATEPEPTVPEAPPARKLPEMKAEKAPDPLMMIPDEPEPAAQKKPPAKKAPAKATVTTLAGTAPGGWRASLTGSRGRIAIAAVIVIVILAALFTVGIPRILHAHAPAPVAEPAGTLTPDATEIVTEEVTEVPVGEPTEALTAAPVPTTEEVSLVPGPVDEPPDRFLVYFEETRSSYNHNVTVLYKGGKGQRAVKDVLVRLTRSDGQVVTGTFKPVQVDSGIDLPGTDRTDRVEVIVHYVTGEEYKLVDRVFEYKAQL